MSNIKLDLDKYLLGDTKSLKDYFLLIRTNLTSFFIIALVITIAVLVYAYLKEDIYKSTVTLKISKQQQNVLDLSAPSELRDLVLDRFIANEIEVMKNYDTRERNAQALIDSFDNSKEKNLFRVLKSDDSLGINGHKRLQSIAQLLMTIVTVEQISGVDLVEISAESPIPYEAALIANTYAKIYKQINLEVNRDQATNIRKFLEEQSKEKLSELTNAENILKKFKESGGIVSLDAQSNVLINQLAQLEAQRDATKVDLMTSNEILDRYKNEVKKQSPQLVEYLESQTSQTYINALQNQIADLEMNRDLALTNKNPNIDVSAKVREYTKKITELKENLSSMISDIKTTAFASSPDQIKNLTQKLIEEEINNRSLSIKLNELRAIISKYEKDFNRIPKASIELAQYQRDRESLQQLYLLVEEKHQEALIKELSQPGNAVIIGVGRVPVEPSKPNRKMFALIGLMAGLFAAYGFVLIKDFFNNKVKTPKEVQKNNLNLLAWIPHLKKIGKNGSSMFEFNDVDIPDSPFTEAFRALRTRIQYTKVDSEPPKTILITSADENEGKTVVSINLALSYVQSKKKTLLIDCDLRRPSIHSIMRARRSPGLVDYLLNRVKFKEIIKRIGRNNFYFITAGTNPLDPAEILESNAMKGFIESIKNYFDIIIIDSAPIISVIDSEILSRLVDGTILVISAERTETELMFDAVELIKKNKVQFLGTVLNNFKNKSGYGYYFKHYYNYPSNGRRNRKHRVKS